jgi:hypothetical protein
MATYTVPAVVELAVIVTWNQSPILIGTLTPWGAFEGNHSHQTNSDDPSELNYFSR